jgi:universal stress protein A
MSRIRTILCPVDLSPLSRPEVGMAVELARALGAELVLHHNLSATGPGMAKGWEWKENHRGAGSQDRAEAGMKALLAEVPDGVAARSLITAGPLTIGIERLAEELPADLVVLGCHGSTTDDHSSLTEVLLHHCDCPILVLHECPDGERARGLDLAARSGRPLRILVPTDLSAGGVAAVRYALDLVGGLPLAAGARCHLLHVVETRQGLLRSLLGRRRAREPEAAARAEAEARLAELVPAAMAEHVTVRVEAGRPAAAILRAAAELEPDLIVMGEHTRDLVDRLLTRDVAQGVLHGARCPVWFVPPPRLAA